MSRTRIRLAAASGLMLLPLALAPRAEAQRVSTLDGNKLLGLCTSRAVVACDAYVSGVADTATATDAMAGETGRALGICVPKQVTGVQLRQTVVASLKAHPQDNARSGVELVLRALKAAYACDKSAG